MRMCNFKAKQDEIKYAIEDEEYEIKRKIIGGATYENNKSR